MKILLVSENLPAPAVGGLGMHVVALGNALIAAGHEVALMGKDSPSYESCAAAIGFRGTFIAGFGDPFRGWKERPLGIFNPLKRPYFARRIAQGILRHAFEFDVVHYHGHHPMVGRYLPDSVNFVQTRHDQGSDCVTHVRFRQGKVCTATDPRACAGCAYPAPGPLRTSISAAAVRRYRAESAEAFAKHPVVFVSDFLRNNAARTLGPAAMAKSFVVHNFVSENSLASQPQLPVQASTRIVVAGRLEAAKGILSLLRCLEPVLLPPWTVDVYGDGPDAGVMRQQFGGNTQIGLHGHASHSQVLTAMATARVVVVPSMWEEAFGFVTLEALKLGRPCYALNRGATPDLARYGAPGQLKLFDNLPSLVKQLVIDLPSMVDHAGGVSADTTLRLAEILEIYGHGAGANQ